MTKSYRCLFVALTLGIFAVFSALTPASAAPRAKSARSFDGPWSVTIYTQRGNCSASYNYQVQIIRGTVVYSGGMGSLRGHVKPNGSVYVSASGGNSHARGGGKLTARGGGGSWRGAGDSASCSGRWVARRG